jgi:hypothetical protein
VVEDVDTLVVEDDDFGKDTVEVDVTEVDDDVDGGGGGGGGIGTDDIVIVADDDDETDS